MQLSIKSKKYVNELPQHEQTVILSTIEKTLITEGIHTTEEMTEALENALNSKYSDVAHVVEDTEFQLTQTLYFNGLTLTFQEISEDGDRIYTVLDTDYTTLHEIHTNDWDYDGVLIGVISKSLSDDLDDDYIRHFDCITGIENKN